MTITCTSDAGSKTFQLRLSIPGEDDGGAKKSDEDDHVAKGGRAHAPVGDSPRKHVDHLHVKGDEEQRRYPQKVCK